jgi:hypothetical protein
MADLELENLKPEMMKEMADWELEHKKGEIFILIENLISTLGDIRAEQGRRED